MAERKLRISPKLRAAITAMVEEGLTRAKAAEKAGITDHALYCALRKAHVAAFRGEVMRALRDSETSRTIARAVTLADSAVSEHVRLQANEWIAGVGGLSPVAKGEIVHRHEGQAPGLTIVFAAAEPVGAIIAHQPQPAVSTDRERIIASLPKPVPHPAMAMLAQHVDPHTPHKHSVRTNVGNDEQ